MPAESSDNDAASFSDLYADLHNIAGLFYKPDREKRKGIQQRAELQIISQNLQGFTEKRREKWLNAWKQRTDSAPADIIFVQDTHIKTLEEVEEIKELWNRICGVKNPDQPLSYWTTTATRSGGVEVLLQPRIAYRARPWHESGWTDRRAAIQLDEWRLINIYAPVDRCKKREFYDDLHDWLATDGRTILGGDFNAVLNPRQDRLVDGKPSLASCESSELQQLVENLEMLDATTFNTHADEDSVPDPLTHYTYWRKRSASRIDRFYVSREIASTLQWVGARDPACYSDHQELRLWLTTQHATTKKTKRRTNYPFNSSRPEWVRKRIKKRIKKMSVTFLQQACPARAWDTFANQLSSMIGEVARMDREHTSSYYAGLRANQRVAANSRIEVQRTNQQQRDRQASRAFGRSLQPTAENLKRFYKKHANWQRDQHITRIDPSPGHYCPDSMPTAERMASEWNDILGSSHATVDPSRIPDELRKFHEIPIANRLSVAGQNALTAPITIDAVKAAIDQLPRDKSGGSSRLSHDFYKEFKDELAECLVVVYQDIQKGAPVPESFLDAVIVPLRKKGDSSNAMDYRPISLLNTAYKILGRIYADRIHQFLPRLISPGQQGFVRGRLMTRSVTMVQALLKTVVDNPDLDWMNSPAILCLDLRKAYDTLCRNFMAAALDQYRIPQQFLDVFHCLHNGTKTSYIVNGDESTKWTINSGILQGCPLAPLLFVLAVDFLGRAIEAHPQITGLEIPGSGGVRHVFNGFVDDSTVFLSATWQLKPLNLILKNFGELSGIIVQPSKSVLIPLNTALEQRLCHGFQVLSKTDTTRILGYHLGTKDTTNLNWEIRLQNVKKRLQIATQVANSVKQRVILFNTVVLPAILFTGQHIPITPEALHQLEQLQKRFIWRGTTAEVQARHKIPPALVFASEGQGGLGLQNIELALRATRMNQAEQWMQSICDHYTVAWHFLAHPDQDQSPDCCVFTPTSSSQVKACRRKRRDDTRATVQALGPMEVWADQTDRLRLLPAADAAARVHQTTGNLVCYWHHSGALQCALPEPTEGVNGNESVEYLRAANWCNNSCIVNRQGKPLKARDYPLIQPCSLLQLQISRIGPGEFVLNPPLAHRPFKVKHHNQIRRWCASIFSCIPDSTWSKVDFQVRPWQTPALRHAYRWVPTWQHSVTAFALSGSRTADFRLEQSVDGWTWGIVDRNHDKRFDRDFETLKHSEQGVGLAFQATPYLHATPWQVPEQTLARNLRKTIRHTRSKRIRKLNKFSVQHVIEK